MSATQLFAVGGRLLGIYFLVVGLATIPAAVLGYFVVSNVPRAAEHGFTATGTLIAGLCSSGAWSAAALLIIRYFARQPLDSQHETHFDQTSLLVGAVKLIGCYWLVDSMLRSIQIVVSSLGIDNAFYLRLGDLVAGCVGVLVGWLVLRFAEPIVRRSVSSTAPSARAEERSNGRS